MARGHRSAMSLPSRRHRAGVAAREPSGEAGPRGTVFGFAGAGCTRPSLPVVLHFVSFPQVPCWRSPGRAGSRGSPAPRLRADSAAGRDPHPGNPGTPGGSEPRLSVSLSALAPRGRFQARKLLSQEGVTVSRLFLGVPASSPKALSPAAAFEDTHLTAPHAPEQAPSLGYGVCCSDSPTTLL